MNPLPPNLYLVPRPSHYPELKDITGEDIRCDCICALWTHTGKCWDHATIRVTYRDGSTYNTCKPCYDDVKRWEAEL